MAPGRRAVLRALGAAALAGACRRRSGDPVQDLLAGLEGAAESRDVDAFARNLSPAFKTGPGQPRAEALAELRRYFAAYETIRLQLYEPQTDRQGGRARVVVVVAFNGEARKVGPLAALLPPSAVYRFTLDAADEGGTWRVQTASWEPVSPSPAP